MKTLSHISLILMLALSFATAPVARAGTYVGTHGEIHQHDVFALDIVLDTEGKTLNAVEGTIGLSDGKGNSFVVKDISVAGSALTVWPRKPSLSDDRTKVTFIGGSPTGFNDGRTLLFTLFIQAGTPGTLHVEHSSVTGYQNDGLGTKVSYKAHANDVQILPAQETPSDALLTVISGDNEPPLPFTIELLQDPSQNAGMKYLSFETTDARSGISYYEVTEGDRDAVRTGTSYVLQDQSKAKDITVRAFDRAGNMRVSEYGERTHGYAIPLAIAGLIIILAIAFRKKILNFFKKSHA